MMEPDFGKVRVYECECGGYPVRPLRGMPKPCDRCDADIVLRPYMIEDHKLFIARMTREEEGK